MRAKIVERPEDYPYSSYKTYILSQGEALVTRSTILEMLATKEAEARKRYKTFVEASLGEDVESPLKKVYGGMILGGERFIKDVLGRIEEEQLEKESVSHRKALRAPYGAEEVLQAVCKHFGVLREEITSAGGGEVRKICLYLMKKQTIAHTREIGDLLNMSYAAAAKMYQRFAKELAKDEDLRRVIAGIDKKLSYVEG